MEEKTIWHCDIANNDERIFALFNLFAYGPFTIINIKWKADGMEFSALDSNHILLLHSWTNSDGKQEANESWYSFTTEEFKRQRGKEKKSRKYRETIIEIHDTSKEMLFYWALANGDTFKVNLTRIGDKLDIPNDWFENLKSISIEKSKNVRPGRKPDTVVIENLAVENLNKICGTFNEFSDILKMHCVNQQLVCSTSDKQNLIECEARQDITTSIGEPAVLLSLKWFIPIIKYFEATGEQLRLYMTNQIPLLVEDMQAVTLFLLAVRVMKEESDDDEEGESE